MSASLDAIGALAAAWLAFARERAEIGFFVLVPLAVAAAGLRFVRRGRGAPHLQSALALAALLLLALPVERLVPAAWIPRRVAAALGPLSFGPLPPSLRDARPAPIAGRAEEHRSAVSDAAAPLPAEHVAPPARTSVATGLFAAWSAIVGALLLRLAWCHRRTRAALRRATPLPASGLPLPAAELARRARLVSLPPLVVSDELPAPSTCGVLRPVVVLPPGLRESAGDEGTLFVLLHELAHVRRRDPRLALVERLVRIAAFFHPTSWIAGELLARERERACDDAALSALPLAARPACAEALLQVIERSRRHAPAAATALALSRGGRAVKNRLLRILDPTPAASRMTARARCAAGAAASVLLVALAARASAPATSPQAAPAAPRPDAPSVQLVTLDTLRADHATVTAVRAGIDWLLRHQEEDGHWSAAAFDARCKDATCTGHGDAKYDVGVTALAAEALLGVGDEKLRPAATRALDWIVAQQDGKSGLIRTPGPPSSHAHYEHVYATLALVDAAGLEPVARWKEPAKKAVDYLLRARNPYRGWRYGVSDGDNDSSLTGLIVVVLAGAHTAGVVVAPLTDELKGGLAYLDEMTEPTTGRTGYQQKGGFTARAIEAMERFPAQSSECLTAISLNARLSVAGAGDALVQKQIALLAAQPPKWDEKGATTDFYYWYFATRGLMLAGGDAWTTWKTGVAAELVAHQSKQGDGAGSFPPADAWSGIGGRVYATALNLLTLEICARSR